MFKSAFLSEYSLSSDDDLASILKSHLLSNGEIVVPAAALRHDAVSQLIHENIASLSNGVVKIAHGTDCDDLLGYMAKYPETPWSNVARNTMLEFNSNSNDAIYNIKDTFDKFNAIMRRNARGESEISNSLFTNIEMNEAILSGENKNLFEYFDIVKACSGRGSDISILNSYLKYIYNLCGALSTNSGNTFSLENSNAFNYISARRANEENTIHSGLTLLISAALDVTDGIEDFSFLNDLSNDYVSKLSFESIMEIRESWLHGTTIKKYEEVVQNCVIAISAESRGDLDTAFIHIDRAFELRSEIGIGIKSRIQSEIAAYKVHRLSRFLADSAVQFVSFFSGVSMVQSIMHAIYGATTEVAVLTNRETDLKRLVKTKTRKAKEARTTAELMLNAKSPTLEYLRKIDESLPH